MPAYDECRDDRLVATGRHPEEINHWDLMLHCLSEPAVIGRCRIGSHKGVFDGIITAVYLAVSFPLILIPDPCAPSREHGFNAEEPCHLAGLKDTPLRVDQGDALTIEFEPGGEVSSIEDAIPQGSKAGYLIESRLPQPDVLGGKLHGAILPQAGKGPNQRDIPGFRTRPQRGDYGSLSSGPCNQPGHIFGHPQWLDRRICRGWPSSPPRW